MKITTLYLPMCLGFIVARGWKHNDIPLSIVGVIAFILNAILIIRG